MNCCNDFGDCNQGRDCPVRVAKYKPVMLAAEPLPPSVWRKNLMNLGVAFACASALVLTITVIASAVLWLLLIFA